MAAEPARKHPEIEPDIRPKFGLVKGGGESTPSRANLKEAEDKTGGLPGTGSIKDKESQGGAAKKGWDNNVSGKPQLPTKAGGRFAFMKKKGPMSAIIAMLLLGGGGVFMGGTYATFMGNSIYSNMIGKFNSHQETSYSRRLNKLINNRLFTDVTTAPCRLTKIACRFKIPSNRFLGRLEKSGIIALDADGVKIPKSLLQTKRTSIYRFTKSNGGYMDIKPGEYFDKLADGEFSAAMRKAVNPRYLTLVDEKAQSVFRRLGALIGNTLKKVANKADVTSELNKVSSGVDKFGYKAVTKASTTALQSLLEKVLGEEAEKAIRRLATTARGDGAMLAAGAACTLTDFPKMFTSAARAYQAAKLAAYAMPIVSAIAANRAGKSTDKQMSAVFGKLTETDKNGRSALDSFGINNITNNNTTPNKNSNYKKFVPGLSASTALAGVTKITDSTGKEVVCGVASNPATGTAINMALAANAGETFGGTAIVAGINWLLGTAASLVISKVGPTLIKFAISHIPPELFAGVAEATFGNTTKDLVGEDVGDALVSGTSQTISQASNVGGNMPMTKSDAIAYDKETEKVQLAFAKEEQATKSPFDISSKYTWLGSIASSVLPYFQKTTSSTSSILGSIGNVISGSFGKLAQTFTAKAGTVDASEYELCSDPTIVRNDIAAGPFCNIIYGIPVRYLDRDPNEIVLRLTTDNDIDADGNAIGKYKDWLEQCTDGTLSEANNCKIDSDKAADFALYTIDTRVLDGMDTDPPVATAAAPTTTTTTSSATVVIDPGHSGGDLTVIDPLTGIEDNEYKNTPETQDMWDVAVKLQAKLEAAGYTAILTKKSAMDIVSKRARADAADNNNAAIAVSLHTSGSTFGNYGQIYVQTLDSYRTTPTGAKVFFTDANVAALSQKYGQDMLVARRAIEGNSVVITVNTSFNTRFPRAMGNIPMNMLFSKVPWVYNEAGAPQSDSDKDLYAQGVFNGIVKAVPLATTSGGTWDYAKYGFPAPEADNPILKGGIYTKFLALWRDYMRTYAIKAGKALGMDAAMIGGWTLKEGISTVFHDYCIRADRSFDRDPNTVCPTANWQVGYGFRPIDGNWLTQKDPYNMQSAINNMYGAGTSAASIGQGVIERSKTRLAQYSSVPIPIINPSTFPTNETLQQIIAGAKNSAGLDRQLIGILSKDDALGTYMLGTVIKSYMSYGAGMAKSMSSNLAYQQNLSNCFDAVYKLGLTP